VIEKPQIPDLIRNNAKWWAGGTIGDNDFVSGYNISLKKKLCRYLKLQKLLLMEDQKKFLHGLKTMQIGGVKD